MINVNAASADSTTTHSASPDGGVPYHLVSTAPSNAAAPDALDPAGCTLYPSQAHLRASGNYETVGSKPYTKCSYAVTTIHQSNQMYKYHLFDTAVETVGPSFTGGATGVATYTQNNTVVNCTDAKSTTWFSVTKGYVVVGGRTYESTVTSKDVSLACGT